MSNHGTIALAALLLVSSGITARAQEGGRSKAVQIDPAEATKPRWPQRPDLVVTAVGPPLGHYENTVLPLQVSVSNQGSARSDSTLARVTWTKYEGGQSVPWGAPLERIVLPLEPGKSRIVSFATGTWGLNVRHCESPRCTVEAIVDPLEGVKEINESNNTKEWIVQWHTVSPEAAMKAASQPPGRGAPRPPAVEEPPETPPNPLPE